MKGYNYTILFNFLFTKIDLSLKAQMPRTIWDTWWYLRYLPGAGSIALNLWKLQPKWDSYAQATELNPFICFVGSHLMLVLVSSSVHLFCTSDS